MSKENIDDISMIEKENQNFFKDESEMSLYHTLFTLRTPQKVNLLRTTGTTTVTSTAALATPAALKDKPKAIYLINQKKDVVKQMKYPISPPTAAINKPINLIVHQSDISTKPITDFLSDRECFHLSSPQSEYMSVLDSLYSSKIKKISEIDSKYDSELFGLREYLDGNDGNNINNIIYNSVLKDKIEELRLLEKEFSDQKAKALLSYNQRGKKMSTIFEKEIYNTIEEIKSDVINQMAKLSK